MLKYALKYILKYIFGNDHVQQKPACNDNAKAKSLSMFTLYFIILGA